MERSGIKGGYTKTNDNRLRTPRRGSSYRYRRGTNKEYLIVGSTGNIRDLVLLYGICE